MGLALRRRADDEDAQAPKRARRGECLEVVRGPLSFAYAVLSASPVHAEAGDEVGDRAREYLRGNPPPSDAQGEALLGAGLKRRRERQQKLQERVRAAFAHLHTGEGGRRAPRASASASGDATSALPSTHHARALLAEASDEDEDEFMRASPFTVPRGEEAASDEDEEGRRPHGSSHAAMSVISEDGDDGGGEEAVLVRRALSRLEGAVPAGRGAVPVAAPIDFSSWWGLNLRVFPPVGIAGVVTLSWLYCALMAEGLGVSLFPYTLLPDALTYEFDVVVTGARLRFGDLWPGWVAAFRSAMLRVGVQGVPHDLHWPDHVQDDVVAEVFRDDDERPVPEQVLLALDAFVHSLGAQPGAVHEVGAQRRRMQL